MTTAKTLYEEDSLLIAKFNHPKSHDYLNYKTKIVIKDSGKYPIQMSCKFTGIPPEVSLMPPEDHVIKAGTILDLNLKIQKWLKKYGFEIV
jgi:hypothetical protein